MKPILKKIAASYIVLEIIALCAICAATLITGCLDFTESPPAQDGGWGIADDVEYVATPRPTTEPVESMNVSGDSNAMVNATET